MELKKCSKCSRDKHLFEFRPIGKDGKKRNFCIECDRSRINEYKARKRALNPNRRIPKTLEEINAYKNAYRKEIYLSKPSNLFKYLARYKSKHIVINEDDVCCFCGAKEELQKHHPDYLKPLYIVIMCKKCHALLHKYSVRTL